MITPETTCTRESVALNAGGTRAAKSDYTAHTAQSFVGLAATPAPFPGCGGAPARVVDPPHEGIPRCEILSG